MIDTPNGCGSDSCWPMHGSLILVTSLQRCLVSKGRRGKCALDGARLHFCVLAQTKARKAVIRFALGFAAIR